MKPRNKKILMVDDDLDFVEAISSFLTEKGYTVLKAYNGKEGLQLAKMELHDLIIMDIKMTERTEGLFVVQEIRRIPELKSVPIFVLSSLYDRVSDFKIYPDKVWLPCDEFFKKPVNLNNLLEKIEKCIGSSEKPTADKSE